MLMGNGSGNVSMHDFRRLEEKVNRIIELHSADAELSAKEKKLVREAKKDIRKKPSNFLPLK